MADLNLFSKFDESVDKLTDFKDSILSLYDAMMNEGGVEDQSVLRELAQLRAKTDITLKEIS